MKRNSANIILLFFLIIGAAFFLSCSGGLISQGKKLVDQGEYSRAIELYYQEIAENPQKSKAWSELGFAYYKSGELIKAEDALKNASLTDPRTFLCQGLVFEAREEYDKAIKAFGYALGFSPDGRTSSQIKSHLDELIRLSLNKEISDALSDESNIDVSSIPENTMAVVNFDGSLLPPETAPLAFGLAEITSADLSKVSSLKLVERMKIDILLKELQLSKSEYANTALAPRVGRILGSRNIVTAKLTGTELDKIRLDGVIINTVDKTSRQTDPGESKIENIFKIQKDFVFNIIDDLGIKLTAAERDSIMQFPTESALAFLAYSRGLEHKSNGDFGSAQIEFEIALELDNSFSEAGEELLAATAASMAQQFGVATIGDLEVTFMQGTLSTSSNSGQWLTGLLTETNILEPEGEDPSDPTKTTPKVKDPIGSAAVRGDLDGD